MCTRGSSITVCEIDQIEECQYLRMRSLAMREAQEAMEEGVSVRENGYPDVLA
jgi:hypothetical protein